MAGMMHGLAVHAKLYPIIYTLSFMTYLAYCDEGQKWKNTLQPNDKIKKNSIQKSTLSSCYPFPWLQPKRLMHLIQLWIYRLLNPSSLLFLLSFSSTFGIFTYLAIVQYGKEALEEGLLYHFSRVDHRHNYSMFWYWIYLARARLTEYPSSSSSLAVMGKALLLPQIVLLLYSSLGIAPYDLSFALFIQTFLFVTQNKVITAQYFTWYLCLLPPCSNRINWHNKSLIRSCIVLGISIGVWLGMAFMLEMKGMSVHLLVWLASISFFIANVNLLGMILSNYKGFDSGNDEIKDIQRSTKTKQQ
jgi:phosphatidylinositol glycan class M